MNVVMASTMSPRVKSALAAYLILAFVLVRSAFGGVNQSTCGGPYGGEIRFVTVDPQTPNLLYAGVGSADSFYVSRNWGLNWTRVPVPAGVAIQACAVHPVDHRLVFAASDARIYRSSDGGIQWTAGPAISGTGQNFAMDAGCPSVVFLATSTEVYQSTNRGVSWSQKAVPAGVEIENLSMAPDCNDTLFLGTSNSGILRSTDGGNTWTTAWSEFAEHFDLRCHVQCHPTNPQTLFASIGPPLDTLFRSTDGGTTWSSIHAGLTFDQLTFDPFDSRVLYLNGPYGVYRSANSGQNWQELRGEPGHCLAVDPQDPSQVLYAGTQNGVWRSRDGGSTWHFASSGITVRCTALAVPPPDFPGVYAAVSSGDLYKTLDYGGSWLHMGVAPSSSPIDSMITTSKPIPPSTFATINGDLYFTLNEGATWWPCITGKHIGVVDCQRFDDRLLWACSGAAGQTLDFTGLYHSTDGGVSWMATGQLVGINLTCFKADPDAAHADLLYTAGDDGMFRSTDGGVIWESAWSGLTDPRVASLAIDPNNHLVLYAGTRGSGLFRSFNGSSTWHPAGLDGQVVQCLLVDPIHSAVIAGTPQGRWESPDDGDTWAPSGGYLGTAPIFALDVDTRSGQPAYFTATDRGVYSSVQVTEPTVVVSFRHDQAGNINPSLANQILPATALTFLLDENTFPDASPSKPVILRVQLPPGALLSQTLAWADRPFPLAVSEYHYDSDSGIYEPIDDPTATAGIADGAVEMYLYGQGGDWLMIRISQSTSTWIPSNPDGLLGFTIGVGAGVWPPTGGSNWGESGKFRQENTQFFMDLRNYNFTAQHDTFPVNIQCWDGNLTQQLSVDVIPDTVSLFRLDQSLTSEISLACQMGSVLTDYTTVDLDADGREDVVSIDGYLRRLYWIFRQPDGSFGVAHWQALAGEPPVTVEAADVSGDGSPEILVADTAGNLNVYDRGDLLGKAADPFRPLLPARRVAMAGVPTASLICDVNADGWKDFLYTDGAAGNLTIAFGKSFTSSASYPAGVNPVALAAGDLDGDSRLDIVVANKDGDNVTVYRNQGQTLQGYSIPVGSRPVALGAADFNQDGKAELAVALQGEKSLGVWKADAGGSIDPTPAQKIFFVNEPSALQAENFDGQHGADVLLGFSDYYRLALCASCSDGSLSYAYSINTLGDMELDPVNHVTLTENDVLSVTGGTSYGGICERGGVAAIADQPFNLVHMPRSRNLSFSVVNLDTQLAMLNLELFDDSGQLRRTLTTSIAPGQQFARYLTDPDLFGSDADDPHCWVRGFLTQPQTYGFWLANDGATLNYLDGLPLPDIRTAQSNFVLPGGGDPYREVVLLNPGQEQARLTLRYWPPGGTAEEKSILLPGRGRLASDLGTLFPGMTGEGYLHVESDRPINGCELFGDASKLAVLEGLPVADMPVKLYCPHVASGDLGLTYQSYLTLINPSTLDTSVVLLLFNDGGQLVGGSPTISIPAHSKVHENIATIFGLDNPFSGYLVLEHQGPSVVTGCITFGEAGEGRFLSSLPLQVEGATDYLVGHIANGTLGNVSYFTGMSILNPNGTAQTVRVTAFDQNGFMLASSATVVDAYCRDIFLLGQKLPTLTNLFSGYLRIVNESQPAEGLMVFAMFGDQPLNFLSAVAAQRVME